MRSDYSYHYSALCMKAFVHGGPGRSQGAGTIPQWGQTTGGAGKEEETNGWICREEECRGQVRWLKGNLEESNTEENMRHFLPIRICGVFMGQKLHAKSMSDVVSNELNWLPWSYLAVTARFVRGLEW